MLPSVTNTGGGMQLYGVGGFGAASETIKVLGVPFQWELVDQNILGSRLRFYKLTSSNVAYVPKNKTPKLLAVAIDQMLAKTSAGLLKKDPSLAANPKELLKQAKYKSRLTSGNVSTGQGVWLDSFSSNAYLGDLKKVNNIMIEPRAIMVQDAGDHWRIKLVDKPDGSKIPGVDFVFDFVSGIGDLVTSTVSTTIDFAVDGFEWALNQIEKLACAAAKSDLVKGAATTYATSQGGPVAAAGTTAAINAAASKLCSSGKTPLKAPPPKDQEVIVPWYKRPSTYVIGGGIAAVGTIITLAVRKHR